MMKRTGSTVLVLAFSAAALAADIYVWRDAAGVSHYTTDLDTVPGEFRPAAITVAKDWARAEPAPPAEDPEAAAIASASAAPPNAPRLEGAEVTRPDEIYESAYEAGRRAGEERATPPPPAAIANVGPVIQNVEVREPEPASRWGRFLPFGFLVGRGAPTPVLQDRRSEREKRLPPAQPAPFLQGPAGPPPVSFER